MGPFRARPRRSFVVKRLGALLWQSVYLLWTIFTVVFIISRRDYGISILARNGHRRNRHFSLGAGTHPAWLVLFSEPAGASACYDRPLFEIPQSDPGARAIPHNSEASEERVGVS